MQSSDKDFEEFLCKVQQVKQQTKEFIYGITDKHHMYYATDPTIKNNDLKKNNLFFFKWQKKSKKHN